MSRMLTFIKVPQDKVCDMLIIHSIMYEMNTNHLCMLGGQGGVGIEKVVGGL